MSFYNVKSIWNESIINYGVIGRYIMFSVLMLSPRDVAIEIGPPAVARVPHQSSACLEKTCSEVVCARIV